MMLSRLTTLACTLTALTVTGAIADAAPSLKLGKPKVTRGDKYITDDALLTTVAPDADGTGVGGITGDELRIAGCTDFTSGTLASWEGKKIDAGGGIVIEITAIEEAGTSKRGQPGNHCGFKIFDRATPSLYAEIPLAGVPRFTAPTGVLRDGDKVYVNLNFNGYAKEIDAANFIVALDLAAHQELWRTPKFTSNAAMLAVDDVIITGYGFTKEKASLNVIDTATGKVAQKVALPKAPSQIVRKGDTLFVRIYDGYATIPMTRAKR